MYVYTRSLQVLASEFPLPAFIPSVYHEFNRYLIFDLNFPAIIAGLYVLYYITLEPVAAVRILFRASSLITSSSLISLFQTTAAVFPTNCAVPPNGNSFFVPPT